MKYQIYSVLDVKAQAFAPPFFLHRDEVALRAFRDAVLDPKHPMYAHPADYHLYCLGEFDDNSGFVSPTTPPRFLSDGNGEPENG